MTTAVDHRESRLKTELDKIKDQYEYVIIDNPPALGWLTLNSFTALDKVLVVVSPDVGDEELLRGFVFPDRFSQPHREIGGEQGRMLGSWAVHDDVRFADAFEHALIELGKLLELSWGVREI